MGIGWTRRAGRNKFEFAKDLMEGILKRNSGRGTRMTFCQRREGNTANRGWGGVCDWREGNQISRSKNDRVQAREAHVAKGNESGASLWWLD